MSGPILFKAGMLFFVFVLLECFFKTICFKVVTEKKHDNLNVNVKLFFVPVISFRVPF